MLKGLSFHETFMWTLAIFATCGLALPFYIGRLIYVWYK